MSIDSELIRMGVIRPNYKHKNNSTNVLSVIFQGKSYLSYKEARSKVRSLNLKSPHKWKQHCYIHRAPYGVPTNPDIVYKKNGWTNYRDWLGIKVIKIKKRIKSKKKSTKKIKTFYVKKELNIVKYNLFKKLANHRVPRTLNSIKLIGNLSNKSSYEYKQEDVEKIFKEINKSINRLKKNYRK